MTEPGIDRFLAIGSGPATLCDDLRRQARAVQTTLGFARALHSVESRFAGELFGAELLGFLSDRLRALLQNEPESTAAVTERHAAFDFPRNVSASSSKTGNAVNVPDDGGEQWPATLSRPDHRSSVERASARNAAGGSFLDRGPGVGDDASGWEPQRNATHSLAQLPGGAARSHRAGGAADSTLVRLLREYWKGTRDLSAPNRAAGAPAPGPTDSQARGPEAATPEDRTTPPDQLASRMHAFVSGSLGASPAGRGAAASRTMPWKSDANEPKQPPEFAAEPRWSSTRGDLAEKFADILREQAILHGIDIS